MHDSQKNSRRLRAKILFAVPAVVGAMLTPSMTGTANAATCSPSGAYGADPYYVAGTVVGYSLIAWVNMPGCTTGVIDLEAAAIPGTPGTCTLILPQVPVVNPGGAGCSILYAPSGAAIASSQMAIVANGFAAGTSNVVPLIGTCAGALINSPRCGL